MTILPSTPLLSALAQAAHRQRAAFYAPGHKGGQGILPELRALLGQQVFAADLPELPELDNLFAPEGPILEAQKLAAETFGAEETFFLANGSTCGVEAAVLATCFPGNKVLVPRNVHRSVLAALVLSGASPVYVAPVYDEAWDLAFGMTVEQVAAAWQQHPDLQTAIVVSPSYAGVCANMAAIAAYVHRQSGILIVDEAHGAHLGFHGALPPGAIAAGADVVIQSTHKVLSALTQASMLHVQGQRVDRDRLRQALQLTQSTSPSYLLLASLDAARYQMATGGWALMERTLGIARQVRSQLQALNPIQPLTPEQVATAPGSFQLDLTRLTVNVAPLGITGYTADEFLHQQLQVTAELPTLRQLTFMLTLGNTEAEGDRLVAALQTLIEQAPEWPENGPPLGPLEAQFPLIAEPSLAPRDAFFGKSRTVPIAAAVGQISADALCPYPPGIPVLLPGEVITAAAIDHLQHIRRVGGIITGQADADFRTLRIVDVG